MNLEDLAVFLLPTFRVFGFPFSWREKMKKSSLVLSMVAVALFGLGGLAGNASGELAIVFSAPVPCPSQLWPECPKNDGCTAPKPDCVTGRAACVCN